MKGQSQSLPLEVPWNFSLALKSSKSQADQPVRSVNSPPAPYRSTALVLVCYRPQVFFFAPAIYKQN